MTPPTPTSPAPAPAPPPPPPHAGARRLALGASAVTLALAAAAFAVVLTLFAERLGPRYDATATARHRLTPQTEKTLADLSGPYEIVVAAELARVRPWVRARLAETLDRMDSASENLSVTTIDVGSPDGRAAFDTLLARLAERDAEALGALGDALAAGERTLSEIPGDLAGLAQRLGALADRLDEGDPLTPTLRQWVRALGVQGGAMRQAGERVRALGEDAARRNAAAPLDEARRIAARALEASTADLSTIARSLEAIGASPDFAPLARDAARPLALAVGARRDRLAVAADDLERIEAPDAVRIERALRGGEAALVVGPPGAGVGAVDLTGLLNPSALAEALGAAQTDLQRRAENLLASALASLEYADAPVVVLMHGEAARFVGSADVFTLLIDRLALRGIDLIEWATVLDDAPPDLARVDPLGRRPIVYAVLGTDASASARAGSDGVDSTAGPQRALALADAAARVIARGRPVLLSLIPSALPGFGEEDPQDLALRALGLRAETGAPLLNEVLTPQTASGRTVDPGLVVRPPEGEHPMLRATVGLPTRLDWPIALAPAEERPQGLTITPLLQATPDGRTWAERDWLEYWRIPPESRPLVPDPPAFDEDRDDRAGPWLLAAAIERPAGGGRAVVVGANTWFTDRVTAPALNIDGRLAPRHPGNAELFEAAVLWLAGQEDRLADSPASGGLALVRPLDPAYLSGVRTAVIAGLPALVLVTGLLWRVTRG